MEGNPTPIDAGAASPVRPPTNRRVDAWGRIYFEKILLHEKKTRKIF